MGDLNDAIWKYEEALSVFDGASIEKVLGLSFKLTTFYLIT